MSGVYKKNLTDSEKVCIFAPGKLMNRSMKMTTPRPMRSASRDGLFGMFFLLVLMLMPRPSAAQTDTIASECDTVTVHPWLVDFNCWQQVQGTAWFPSGGDVISGVAYRAGVIASPRVVVPIDTTGLRLEWKDRRSNDNVTYYVMVTRGAVDDLSGYDTIGTFTANSGSFVSRSVSLAAYAGDTVHIALRRTRSGWYLYIRDFRMISDLMPLATLDGVEEATRVGDTVNFNVELTQGDTTGMTVMLHSALKDSTWTMNEDLWGNEGYYWLDLSYDAPGMETVTVTVSNAFGSVTLNNSFGVFTCDTIRTFPWEEDFVAMGSDASYNACWQISGWSHLPADNLCRFSDDEGVYTPFKNDWMQSSANDDYMITPPIAVPATRVEHLALWLQYNGLITAVLSTQGDSALSLFTDTLFSETNNRDYFIKTIPLAPYAGQTIHVGIIAKGSLKYIDRVAVADDTLPVLRTITAPAKTRTDSTIVCSASLRRGDTTGVTYTWHSSLMDTSLTPSPSPAGEGSEMQLTYTVGGIDTITVIATNAYGSDTATITVEVVDCSPATQLPWTETFAEGDLCWYKPAGSNWNTAEPAGYYPESYRSFVSTIDTVDHWAVSKAITLPSADAMPMLFWEAASTTSVANNQPHYSVLVSTNTDPTDLTAFSLVYEDTVGLSYGNYSWTNRTHRSVSLVPFAGQTIHIAFCNHPVSGYSARLVVDNLLVRCAVVPVLTLTAPAEVESHVPVTFTATLSEGNPSGLTYTWHSTLMGGLTPSPSPSGEGCEVQLAYTVGGIDTITVIAANAYGADTTTAVVSVTACPPIATLPWMEDFTSTTAVGYNAANGKIPDCWRRYWNGSNANYAPHVIGAYLNANVIHTYTQSNHALLLMAGSDATYAGYDTVAMVESPRFDTPLGERLLSFYYMCESAQYGTLRVGYLQEGNFVALAELAPQSAGRTDTVSLSGIPADVHRFALRWEKSGTWYGVIVDSLRVFERDSLPSVRINAPATAMVGDTATFRARMTNGLADGLSFTWHSTLMNQTLLAGDQWPIVYTAEGTDTVSVIVTNAYGSDTAWAVVTVGSHPLPQVTLAGTVMVLVPDTAFFTATLNDCSLNGLTYTWHSTLTGQTAMTNGQWLVAYTAGGLDTVSCIVSNVYGADTAVVTVRVYNCNGIVLPYVEDFDVVPPVAWNSTGTNALPPCWSYSYNGSNASIHLPTVVSSYQYISNLSDNALLMIAGTSNSYATWVQTNLPLFNLPLSSLTIALDYSFEHVNAGTLTVGYEDENLGFFPIDTLTPHAGDYTRDTIYFANITAADNSRIAVRFAYSGNMFYGVAIDNIEVFINNGIMAPEMLTVENVTATCATLRWSEVDTATAYHVSLSGAMTMDTVLTDTSLTLCNLLDDADYSVRVVPMVGSDEGRSASTTFHTLMLCAPLANVSISPEGIISWQYDTLVAEQAPAGVEIEVIDQQGQTLVLTDTAYFSPYVPAGLTPGHTYSFAVHTLCASATANTADTVVMQVAPSVCAEAASNSIPTNSHFMDNFWESNYSQVIYPASFAAGIDTLYGIALRVAQYEPYSWQTTSGTCRYDIYVGQTNGTHTSPLTSDSLTMVVQNKNYSLSGTDWKDFVFNTPYIYDGTGDLVVTIVGRQSSTVYHPVYGVHTDATCTHFVQDEDHLSGQINPSTFNFEWEDNTNIPDIRLLGGCGGSTNTCLAPEVEVTAIDTHNVSLQWQQRGSESLWQVEYRPVGTNAWQMADTTSATSFTITGLAQATHYVMRVGAVCSDSLILYGFPDSATTLCGYMELPYTISFLADEYPCWTLGSNVYHNDWNGVCLSEWSTNDYIISPEVNTNIANLRAIITSLRAIAESYESRFAVGVCDADGSNVTWIDTIGFLQQNVVQTNEVHFNHYTGSGHYIILKGVEGSSYIRQFTLEPFAGCVPVHDVTVDAISEHSAQLTWVPELATNTWTVYLDSTLVSTTTTPSYTLTGLSSNTQYTVAVREICGAGDTSTAVIRMFQTLCDAFALPYFEEFDQAPEIGSERILTDCWTLHATGNYASAYCIGDQWTYTCLSFYNHNEGYNVVNYLSSPRLTVGSGGALVSFKGQTTYFDTFTVGIMLSPYDTSTFIPVRDITVSSGGMAWYSFSTDTVAGAPTSGTFTVAFRFNGENGSGVIDSLFVDAIPVPTYALTLAVNDTAMGTVSGGGTYEEGIEVLITATPNAGYRFVMWNDSVTMPQRSVKVDTDTNFTAYFAPDTVWHTVTINAQWKEGCAGGDGENLGSYVSGAGTYRQGDTVTLSAVHFKCPAGLDGWVFVPGDTIRENPYSFVITSDTVVTAVFVQGVGIADAVGASFALYPNPARGEVTLDCGGDTEAVFIDLHGREVLRTRCREGKNRIDIGALPAGVYYVRLAGTSASATLKLVIQ